MRLFVLLWGLILPVSSWANASQPKVIASAPSEYTVKEGDTLWDISARFLANPWLWPKLWQANSYIDNPHLIYPGDQLRLVWRNGQPYLLKKKVVKLSPSIRIKRSPITTLQASVLLPYLAEHRLLTSGDVERLPRVLGDSKEKSYMSPGDTIWVDSVLEPGEWRVYRPGKVFTRQLSQGEDIDPVRGLKEIAKVTVVGTTEELSQVSLQSFRQELRQNDVLLPASVSRTQGSLSFVPSEPPRDIRAMLLGHFDNQSYIAVSDVVVIDRGHLDNVSAGNVFRLYLSGAVVEGDKGGYQYKTSRYISNQYPLSKIGLGEVMVIRPYEHFSLAVVMKATEPFVPTVLALPPPANDAPL